MDHPDRAQAKDSSGRSAAHYAAADPSASQSCQILDVLHEKGADLGAKDQFGRTPLMVAVMANRVETVKKLLELAPETRTEQDMHGLTALHHAVVATGRTDTAALLELLLQDESSELVNIQDKDGNTALHYAAFLSRSSRVIQCLKSAGADPTAENKDGKFPFDVAAGVGNDLGAMALVEEATA